MGRTGIVLLVLVTLLSTPVFALPPTMEVECCGYLGHYEDAYDDELVRRCPELNLTEEKCRPILAGFAEITELYGNELEARGVKRANRLFGAAATILLIFLVFLFWFIIYRVKMKKFKSRKK